MTNLRNRLRQKQGNDDGGRVFAACLEWDHKDPQTKCRVVSKITNKQERLKEIAKCQLLCVFCHRFKTYVNEDCSSYMVEGKENCVTRVGLKELLQLKADRLSEQGTNGICPGVKKGHCPFVDEMKLIIHINTRM